MRIYTRYGSQVEIVSAYKSFANLGAFLVQARVIQPANLSTCPTEQAGQIVGENDSFSQGWIPSNQLVCDSGQEALVSAIIAAPTAAPRNPQSLLRLHWSTLFGQMEMGDIVNVNHLVTEGLDTETRTNSLAQRINRFATAGLSRVG